MTAASRRAAAPARRRSPDSTKVSLSAVARSSPAPRAHGYVAPAGRRVLGLGRPARRAARGPWRPGPRRPRPALEQHADGARARRRASRPRPRAGTACACTTACTSRAPARRSSTRHGDPALRRRQRVQPEDVASVIDGEGAERADHQLAEVVAGDVLDHPAAGLGDHAVGAHHGDADQQVAGGAGDARGAGRWRWWPGRRRRWRRARSRRGPAAGRPRRRRSCTSASRAPGLGRRRSGRRRRGRATWSMPADVERARRPTSAAAPRTAWCRARAGPR